MSICNLSRRSQIFGCRLSVYIKVVTTQKSWSVYLYMYIYAIRPPAPCPDARSRCLMRGCRMRDASWCRMRVAWCGVNVMHAVWCTHIRSSPNRHGTSAIRETVITSVANKTRGFRVYGSEKGDEKKKPMDNPDVGANVSLPIFLNTWTLSESV